ncbi:MAG: peptide chain release factor N(5)-glutamine methyltransferase [Acetobacteraceae bacterium]|nr:peptide chain release factor N(5)-glutamine methyltransferase [Acetobacteraceae bacterium]
MEPGPPGPGTRLVDALAWGRAYLESCGVPNAALEARVLLGEARGRDPAEYFAQSSEVLQREEADRYRWLVGQRGDRRRPLQYVLGRVEFLSLPFVVREGVFIPRPETELLVEEVLRRLAPARPWRIIDLGTGSGVVAVCLALRLPRARVYALDCSPAALEVAAENARRHGVAERVVLLQGDMLEPFFRAEGGRPGNGADALACNPPYVATGDFASLQPEVARHEPREALDGGPEGLDFYRRLLPGAREALATGGILALEVGAGQAEAVSGMLEAGGFERLEVIPDYAGVPRVVVACSTGPQRSGRGAQTGGMRA